MRFRATSPLDYYRPKPCERRVALRYRGVPEAAPSEFVELLYRLGIRHETAHLASFAAVKDLRSLEDDEARERETLAAIRAGEPVIYQARFRAEVPLDGETHELVGEPDFLILSPGNAGYVIRDSKLARRVDEEHHLEIGVQLQLYGFLYERAVGAPPAGLEVHAGTGELVPVPYEGREAVLTILRDLRRMRLAPQDAYEPVGWSKCGDCRYRELCWNEAEAARDVAILPAVDQRLARRLRDRGVADIPALRAALDRPDFHDLFYEKAGKDEPERMKSSARNVLRHLDAYQSKAPVPIAPVELPDRAKCVMLDLEGLVPPFDETEKIYLWGVKDFRSDPPRYLYAEAGFGEEGDRRGWDAFLRIVSDLFDADSDLRFVHYGTYEKTKIEAYLERFGDLFPPLPPGEGRGEGADSASAQVPLRPGEREGLASRLLSRLFDLYRAVKGSAALPVASYGLKQVEKVAGFVRRLPDTSGAWATCRYIEATETADPDARARIAGAILAYNEEDLDATRAVLEWMRNLPGPTAYNGAPTADGTVS